MRFLGNKGRVGKSPCAPWAFVSAIKYLPLFIIRAYQLIFSPLKLKTCRFYPSCSQYAYGAIDEHGLTRGSLLAIARLLRCHPFHLGGLDPVPKKGGLK